MTPEQSDNAASPMSGTTSTGNVTSGNASDAMIRAATAASSAEATEALPAGAAAALGTPPAGGPKPADTIADATGQPQQKPETQQPQQQEAPEHRITAAVRNARTEMVRQFDKHIESTYGWAKGVDPKDGKLGVELLSQIRRDPRGVLRDLQQALGGGGQAPMADDGEYPEADLVAEDGRKAYSDKMFMKALDIHARRVEERILGKLRPDLEYISKEKTTQAEATERAQRTETANNFLEGERGRLAHFTKENEPLILERMQQMDPSRRRQLGPFGSFYAAYNELLSERVFPSIESTAAATAETKVRESFAKKAATSRGSTHPTDQGGEGKSAKLDNVNDLAKHMERMAQTALA